LREPYGSNACGKKNLISKSHISNSGQGEGKVDELNSQVRHLYTADTLCDSA